MSYSTPKKQTLDSSIQYDAYSPGPKEATAYYSDYYSSSAEAILSSPSKGSQDPQYVAGNEHTIIIPTSSTNLKPTYSPNPKPTFAQNQRRQQVEIYYNECVLPLVTRSIEHLLLAPFIVEESSRRDIEGTLLAFLKNEGKSEEEGNVKPTPGIGGKKSNKVLLEKIDEVFRSLTKRILNKKPEDVKQFMMEQLE